MKHYTIFFGKENLPVYEGVKDGRYWLGGTPSLMFPLIFNRKKDAEEALKSIKKRIEVFEPKNSIFRNNELKVGWFTMNYKQ